MKLRDCFSSYLTCNMPLIHTSFTCWKWNMGEMFGLKFHFLYLHTRRLMGSTNQADPSCFYFRFSWILMEWCCFYFFVLNFFQAYQLSSCYFLYVLTSKALQITESQMKMLFHYKVETTWISLIGWPFKTANT